MRFAGTLSIQIRLDAYQPKLCSVQVHDRLALGAASGQNERIVIESAQGEPSIAKRRGESISPIAS